MKNLPNRAVSVKVLDCSANPLISLFLANKAKATSKQKEKKADQR